MRPLQPEWKTPFWVGDERVQQESLFSDHDRL
jgi:hypothetical protein